MEENLKWLWYAFSAAWILHILYLGSISVREKKAAATVAESESRPRTGRRREGLGVIDFVYDRQLLGRESNLKRNVVSHGEEADVSVLQRRRGDL